MNTVTLLSQDKIKNRKISISEVAPMGGKIIFVSNCNIGYYMDFESSLAKFNVILRDIIIRELPSELFIVGPILSSTIKETSTAISTFVNSLNDFPVPITLISYRSEHIDFEKHMRSNFRIIKDDAAFFSFSSDDSNKQRFVITYDMGNSFNIEEGASYKFVNMLKTGFSNDVSYNDWFICGCVDPSFIDSNLKIASIGKFGHEVGGLQYLALDIGDSVSIYVISQVDTVENNIKPLRRASSNHTKSDKGCYV